MSAINSFAELEELRKSILAKRDSTKPCISICAGTGCHNLGNQTVISAFKEEVDKRALKAKVDIRESGCHGLCEKGPIVVIYPEEICYVGVTAGDVAEIISQTVIGKEVINHLLYTDPNTGERAVHENDILFYQKQMRLLTGDNARIDPRSIDDYLAVGGYSVIARVLLNLSPEEVITEIKKSGLRGRSGGGFPVGRKWEAGQKAKADIKYVICNCHEGDPGAFVDRRMMEGNPHRVLEGMIIGAYAIGANQGYIFVGDEFPLTVANTEIAINQAEESGLLGKNILGSGFDFTVQINIDVGNYVCGESTALMASMAGGVGEPITKYDHATESGLYAKPTVLNNLQTWANVPLVINQGAANYSHIGTENSKGTRVFSLVGKVNNSGLVEVPMGTSLRDIIFNIGGGIREGKKFKAVQVGGPLGGFVPESQLDLTVDFEEMFQAGLSMGPALIVMDASTCMVDMVKYFLTFLANESCGKCTPCREGLRQMIRILTDISGGRGQESDIELLEALSEVQKGAALCALGQGASSTVTSAIRHFRDEYDAHIKEKQCPALVCEALAPHKYGGQK